MANVIEFSIKGTATSAVSAMKKVSDSIAKMGRALVSSTKWAAAGTAALVGFVKIVNDGIDKTAKFANRLGLAVDQLSKMQFVANQAGISNEQFNMATQRMTRRVAEASQGLGEAKGALIELNIEAESFQKLSLDKQFDQLAVSLGEVEDPAQRLRLAFKLFDSEGTAVLQMLNQGSAEMQRMAKDAEFLGLVIGKQTAANAEELSNAMGRATGSVKGLSRGVAGELTPVMTGLSNTFANFVADNRSSIVDFTKNAIQNFFIMLEVIKQVFDGIKKIFTSKEGFSNYLDNLGAMVIAVRGMITAMIVAVVKIMGAGLKAAATVWGDFFGWVGGAIFDLAHGNEVKDFSETMANSVGDAMAKAGAGLETGLQEPLSVFKSFASDAGTAISDGIGINLDLATEKAKLAITSLSEFGTVAKDQLASTGESISELMMAMDERTKTWMVSLEENSVTFAESFFTLMTTVIDSISQSMADAVTEGASLADAFSQISKLVLNQLISMMVKMGIQRMVLAALNTSATKAETAAEGARAVGTATANGIATMAGAPWPVNMTAPAFGVLMGSSAASGLAGGISTGAGIGASIPIAHGGLTNVPSESTYLLNKGERVLSPNQNKDLTNFMGSDGNSNGSIIIENIDIRILENAANADALLNLSEVEMDELVADKIIKSLNNLDKQGVRPVYSERG